MRVFDAATARAVDRVAIEAIGLPGIVLMEHAALAVVDVLLERWPQAQRVLVACGPGNNGGDGWAVARLLATRGLDVEVVALGEPGGDGGLARRVALALGIVATAVTDAGDLQRVEAQARAADIVVDALFGTGLSRPLSGLAADMVGALAAAGRPLLAVDLPSGLDASRPDLPDVVLWADATVTFVAPKIAHMLAPACEACGEVVVADLGFPLEALELGEPLIEVIEPAEVVATLAPRPRDFHKGDAGRVLIVAGAAGMAGAAILAARAAVRAGAGLVRVAVPEQIAAIVAGASPESMTVALTSRNDGKLDRAAVEQVLRLATTSDAVACGPGLGGGALDDELAETLRQIVLGIAAPLVVDADGLNAFAAKLVLLADRGDPTVLTPHPGELGRLLEIATTEVSADRLAAVRRAAAGSGAVVVAKGRHSLVATPSGAVAINPTGGSALSSGGTGDVLTGIVVALLAAGIPAGPAARAAVYWHAAAGDRWQQANGDRGLRASDVCDLLPQTLVGLR